MSTVAAIVLTYNRVELLSACLAAIARQTDPCALIIVVDNGSTDGTRDFLSGYKGSTRLEVVRIEQNRGPAAGFQAAFRAGLQAGVDLLWVMDDDVIPSPTALTELLRGKELLHASSINPPYLLSLARSPDGSATNVPDLDLRNRVRGYSQWPALLHEGLVPVRRGTFVSAVFPRETVTKFGLPCASMYMWGEDTEYTLRVTRDEPGYIVGHSHVEHLRAQAGSLDITTEPDPKRVALHRILIRNMIYTSRTHIGGSHTRHTVRAVLRMAMQLISRRQWSHARIILSGFVAGMFFSPIEASSASLESLRFDPHPAGNSQARARALIGGD